MSKKDKVSHGRLRINRGTLRGRYLKFAEYPGVRPTLSRVREAVFNILADYAETHGFVDLCAGSGAMGFEAWSLGFDPVWLLDQQAEVIAMLRDQAESLDAKVVLQRQDAQRLARRGLPDGAWVLYADPPYQVKRFHEKMMKRLSECAQVHEGSLYVAEQETPKFVEKAGVFELVKSRKYGRVHIGVYAKGATPVEEESEGEAG